MTQETIGQTLMRLRERSGMTLAEVAAAGGYKGPSSIQTYFNSDYDPDGLNGKTARNLIQALVGKGTPPITREEILALTHQISFVPVSAWTSPNGISESYGHMINSRSGGSSPAKDFEISRNKMVPVYGSALAADIQFDDSGKEEKVEQTLFEMGETIMHIDRPAALASVQKIYALYVSGSSMEPRYRPGDPILVDGMRPPLIGDDVVVQLISPDGGEGITTGLIKTLVRRTSSFIELEQYLPACRFTVPIERIARVHRVIPWREAIGM